MLKFRSGSSYFLSRSTVPGALWLTALVMLVTVALAGCITILCVPVYRVSGGSMEPTMHSGDVVVLQRVKEIGTGDICCFTVNGRIYVKRVIANGGSTVELNDAGEVSVDSGQLREDYVACLARGTVERDFPCTVPENMCFVMGDNRAVSLDSRSEYIGFVPRENIIGRVQYIFCLHRK